MPAIRSDKNSRQHRNSVQSADSTQSIANSDNDLWVAKDLKGDCPPLNDHARSFVDPRRERIYVYGGCLPDDDNEMPVPYLHVLDTKTMKFTDLTNALTYITPGDPYSEAMRKREIKTLPLLLKPGVAFGELKGLPMIFIFGGHDASDEVDGPSAALVAINTEHKEWYFVEFEDREFPPPAPRINPVIVASNGRLYIFSGISNFGQRWVYHRSFSIVDFQLGRRTHKCKWVEVDVPYPANIPAAFEEGLPVLYGHMIILFPGREHYCSDIQFKAGSVVYFNIKTSLFALAKIEGVLPDRGLHWYHISTLDPSLVLPNDPSLPDSPPPPLESWVLLCTWQCHGATNDLAPELWLYRLPNEPNDTMIRLGGFTDRVWGLNKNLQHFILIGGTAILMGSSKDSDAEGTIMLDTYVKIPIQRLVKDALPLQY